MAKNQIATAYVQVVPSMDGVAPKVRSVFSSAGTSSGSTFGTNLVSKVKGLIAAAGIGKALKDSIMSGSDLEQLKGGVQKIFDEMNTATIMADAANAYKDLNMSANQYLATINDVGATFAATMGDEKGYSVARTGLQAISDYASGTGKSVDLLSEKFTMITRSTSSYQSIADQFSGILPATSAGFLEQAQAAGFLSAEYKKLTEVPVDEYQQAVAEMLKKGTAELGLAGNTAAETATTFAGSLAAMQSAFSNFLGALATGEDVGKSLDVLSETVITFVSGNLMPMVGNIFSQLPAVLESTLSLAIQGLNIAANNADAIVQMGIDLVTGIGTAIISAAPYLLDAALNIVMALGNALLSADWASIGSTTISALRDSLDLAAGEILGTDGNIVESVITAISTNLPKLLQKGVEINTNIANGILQNLPYLLETAGNILSHLLSAIMNTYPQVFSAGIDLVLNLANGLINNLPAVITSAISILGQLIATILSHLPQLLESGISLIGQLAAGLIQAIPQVIAAIPQIINSIVSTFKGWNWREIGSNIVSGIANGISSGASAIISAAQSAARAALNAAKRFLGIASPSKVMRDQVGKFIPEGMAIGIEANTKPLTDAMHDLSNLTTSTAQADIARGVKTTGVPVSTTGNVYGNSTFTINVYASDNMDVDELAETVMQKIQFAVSQREVCFVK